MKPIVTLFAFFIIGCGHQGGSSTASAAAVAPANPSLVPLDPAPVDPIPVAQAPKWVGYSYTISTYYNSYGVCTQDSNQVWSCQYTQVTPVGCSLNPNNLTWGFVLISFVTNPDGTTGKIVPVPGDAIQAQSSTYVITNDRLSIGTSPRGIDMNLIDNGNGQVIADYGGGCAILYNMGPIPPPIPDPITPITL